MMKTHDIKALAVEFQSAKPFKHVIIDNFFSEPVARVLAEQFPPQDADFWYRYKNPLEMKLASNVEKHTPLIIWEMLMKLNGVNFVEQMRELSGIENLQADPHLHGGGMHCIPRGGKLDMHIDYALHPISGLQRRLNLIVYLNENWDEAWGGHLEFWNSSMTECVKKIAPVFNRAVIFATGDESFHGHPEPLACPEGVCRKSIALYFLSEPEIGVSQRFKARFVPRPFDPVDEETNSLREKRAGIETFKSVYRTGDKE